MSEVTKKKGKKLQRLKPDAAPWGDFSYSYSYIIIIKSYYIIYYVDNVYCCISDKSKCPPPT